MIAFGIAPVAMTVAAQSTPSSVSSLSQPSRPLVAEAAPTPPFTEASLVGEWDSGCARYVRGPGPEASFIRRHYLFTERAFSARYTFFADEQCKRALGVFHLSGPYKLGKVVPTAPTARDVDVTFARILLTVEAPEFLPRVQMCGNRPWEVGVQQDVTETGCIAFKPKATCGMDYDIVTVAGDVLFPGFRNLNMCVPEGRPVKLQTTAGAVKRK